ncbi:MAG: hypothetical protein JW873_01685 [Candidatus Saganbacteria bacterium]|nr:hypothetical protein [Candidatus Saganbacteria bacterium]
MRITGINFNLVRACASSKKYFRGFPQLRTVMSVGLRFDCEPHDVWRGRGVERGFALHVHRQDDLLIAEQWTYNGTRQPEIRQEVFVAFSPEEKTAKFRTYRPEDDKLAGPANQEALILFQHCLNLTVRDLEQWNEGPVILELENIKINVPDPLPVPPPLACGPFPPLTEATRAKPINFGFSPLCEEQHYTFRQDS